MSKQHYVYLLQNKVNGMCYIGVRSCKGTIWDDGYMGSSRHMTQEDKDNCNKIVLARFGSREEAVAYEIEMHNKFDVVKNPLFYNKAKQTSTGFDTTGRVMSEEEKEKRSKALMGHKGAKTWSGKKLPEATRVKMSQATKGVAKSDQHKKALKESHKDRQYKAYDDTTYTFINKDGTVFTGTQYAICKQFSADKSNINSLIKGKRKSHKGWSIVTND
jgi:hypothetical protein